MKRLATVVLLSFISATALADSLRSGKHFVKIDVEKPSSSSRQYNVQIFDAEHVPVTRLQVATRNEEPAEAETTAGSTHYKVRVNPFGAAYVMTFTAEENGETIDSMRGGFSSARTSFTPPPAPLRTGRDVKVPAVLRRVEAVYTEEARAAGAAGTVVLDVVIEKSGFVRDAVVLKRMGYGLTESAIDAVKQWQFEPSLQEQVPVVVIHEVTIEFKP
jgi:TonB family protein